MQAHCIVSTLHGIKTIHELCNFGEHPLLLLCLLHCCRSLLLLPLVVSLARAQHVHSFWCLPIASFVNCCRTVRSFCVRSGNAGQACCVRTFLLQRRDGIQTHVIARAPCLPKRRKQQQTNENKGGESLSDDPATARTRYIYGQPDGAFAVNNHLEPLCWHFARVRGLRHGVQLENRIRVLYCLCTSVIAAAVAVLYNAPKRQTKLLQHAVQAPVS
jgi:hypothetical protein